MFFFILAESVVTYAGERFDFIVNANQTEGLYWMRFRGLMDCDERFKSAHQVAIVQYTGTSNLDIPEGSPSYNTAHKEGLVSTIDLHKISYKGIEIPRNFCGTSIIKIFWSYNWCKFRISAVTKFWIIV